MKKVYICSPCRGDYENNIQRAKEYSRAAVEKGVIPVTPHIYLTQFMDDNVPEERELALKIGSELVLGCSELWAFGIDHPSAGTRTPGATLKLRLNLVPMLFPPMCAF